MLKKTVILAGTPYFSPVGINAFKDMGNTTKATITHNIKEVLVENGQGGGGNDDKFARVESIKISLDFRRVSVEVLEIGFGGPAAVIATGAVAAEKHTVKALGALIMLDHMQDMSIPLVVTPDVGGDPYEPGVDYIRKRTGIEVLETGAIGVDDVLSCAYTKAKHLRVQAMLNTATERAFMFDGINEKSAALWTELFHRVAWSPAKSFELVGGDQFANFQLEGDVLAWDGITDPAKSKLYELIVGELL
jgi:hypothetical protein